MNINQNGEPVTEKQMFALWSDSATDAERDQAIKLILIHLECHIVCTNATKHGATELVLRVNDSNI